MKIRARNKPSSISTLFSTFAARTIFSLSLTFFAFLFFPQSTFLQAQSTFPQLTERIVDNAHLLDQKTTQNLTNILVQHERKTGDQIVIATLPSLQGQDIESYSNALFRHWGLGQKNKNNGVLFLIAPNDRSVRIEVGYGLEGFLNDATASVIINSVILPQFRKNQYQQGIIDGTYAILQVVNGDFETYKKQSSIKSQADPLMVIFVISIYGFFIIFMAKTYWPLVFGKYVKKDTYLWRGKTYIYQWGNGKNGGSGGSGGSSAGGFRGGGGSSGGGGASGRW